MLHYAFGGVLSLEDMIKKIVEIDEQAQELTDEVQQENVDMVKKVAEQREKLRDEYLTRARKRIDIIKQENQKKAENMLSEAQQKFEKKSAQLDSIYKENNNKWVDAIFNRVIGE